MKQRTTLFTLFLAGALVAPAAFAQDATTTDQQAAPVPTQADASAQQYTDANAPATSGDASAQQQGAAYDEQGKTSGDAGMPPTAATPTQPTSEEAMPTDHGKDESEKKAADEQQDDQSQSTP